jgi:hypothetical protein
MYASGLLRIVLLSCLCAYCSTARADDALVWPQITRQMRPWTYWWWMGSAVDRTNFSKELHRCKGAGLGGVHIIPIYGAMGFEDKYIDYLSPRWMEMLDYTATEAQRLDLGVDMSTGTGWCFGGPRVTDAEANATVVVKTFDLAAGGEFHEKIDAGTIQALVAHVTPHSMSWQNGHRRFPVTAKSFSTAPALTRSAAPAWHYCFGTKESRASGRCSAESTPGESAITPWNSVPDLRSC